MSNKNACRHLIVQFHESGNVEYDFFRHGSEYMLTKYMIEWTSCFVLNVR